MENYALRTQNQPHEKFHIQSMFPSLSAGMSEHPAVRALTAIDSPLSKQPAACSQKKID